MTEWMSKTMNEDSDTMCISLSVSLHWKKIVRTSVAVDPIEVKIVPSGSLKDLKKTKLDKSDGISS